MPSVDKCFVLLQVKLRQYTAGLDLVGVCAFQLEANIFQTPTWRHGRLRRSPLVAQNVPWWIHVVAYYDLVDWAESFEKVRELQVD